MKRFVRGFSVALLLNGVMPTALQAQNIQVELELVLSADSSSSIRGDEFNLQIEGYANAFRDQRVISAIEDLGENGIAVMFTQWSASFQQIVTVPWQHIRNATDAYHFADAIKNQARQFVGFSTATGAAMRFAAQQFDGNGFASARRTIDVVSDERSNEGPHPRSVRNLIIARNITINGLAVLDDREDMLGYFQDNVIGGPNAFVMSVDGYADFSTAIRRKLIREISARPVARAGGETRSQAKRIGEFRIETGG